MKTSLLRKAEIKQRFELLIVCECILKSDLNVKRPFICAKIIFLCNLTPSNICLAAYILVHAYFLLLPIPEVHSYRFQYQLGMCAENK